MSSKFKILSLFTILVITTLSCESGLEGDFNENQLPKTFLTVEKIDRGGDFRLSSQINISWWGSDSDGYIVGYEYAINDTSEGNWTFTRKTDSTFILPITQGLIEDDVLFKIRAVDNNDARDPNGARLIFPIVNTSPEASINQTEIPPDTLFSIASFGWTISDPDGLANIERTEIAINDTVNGWVEIPFSPEEEGRIFISLEVDNTLPGEKEAEVFLGRSYTRALNSNNEPLTVPNLLVDSKNTFYVRTIDAAGATSNVDSLSWFTKAQNSSVLFINDDGNSTSLEKQSEHLSLLGEIGIEPDIWIINTGEVTQDKIALSDQFPSVIDPTLKKTLAKWDHIYWVSNNIDRNITYALDITSDFFDAGGTMFVNIPMKGISQNDEIFNFLPVDSIGYFDEGSIQTGFVINSNTEVNPETGISEVVALTESRQVGVYPIKPVAGSTLLYQTDFRATTLIGSTQDYTRFEGVGVENQEGDLIYFSLDLTNLNGNSNLSDLLNDLLIGRLNFKQ
ncbi:MAG: hypothetical protein JJ971_02200 [Balneolaceae bacterium]|nr:hypothetical protein [Balneolaceae bacterium]MBO6545184.1 hypothetical protein [Balneolaceae bacterium]MBO6646580.1 hypothetical protein [Balneolaceae bacterium]